MKKFSRVVDIFHHQEQRAVEESTRARETEYAHIYFKCKSKKKMSKGMNKRDLIVEPAEAAALEETEGE